MKSKNSEKHENALVLITISLAMVGLALAAGQDVNWDLRNYHLYSAYAYLENRHLLDLSPAGLQSYFNPTLYIFYGWLQTSLTPKGLASAIAIIQSLNFALVFLISMSLLADCSKARFHSFILSAMGMLSVGFMSEIGSSQFDNVVSVFVLMPLLIILMIEGTKKYDQKHPWFLIAGLIAGIGCSLKLVLAIYALGLCIAICASSSSKKNSFTAAAIYCVGVCLGIAFAGGFWFVFLWENFGSPFFPMFNSVFEGDLAQVAASRDERFLPNSIFEYLTYPVLFTLDPLRVSEVPYKQVSWLVIYLILLCLPIQKAILKLRANGRIHSFSVRERLIIIFFVTSFCLWCLIFGIYRYLISLELILPLIGFIVIKCITSNLRLRNIFLFMMIGMTGINLNGIADWGRTEWSDIHYSSEMPSEIQEVDEIILYGQPMAWLIPALDIPTPFIQLTPNYEVSETYIGTLRNRVKNSERLGLIYDPDVLDINFEFPDEVVSQYFPKEAELISGPKTALNLVLGLDISDFSCESVEAGFAAADFSYEFCVN